MPAGIIRTQFGASKQFQDIYNIQDSRLYNEKKQVDITNSSVSDKHSHIICCFNSCLSRLR